MLLLLGIFPHFFNFLTKMIDSGSEKTGAYDVYNTCNSFCQDKNST